MQALLLQCTALLGRLLRRQGFAEAVSAVKPDAIPTVVLHAMQPLALDLLAGHEVHSGTSC